MQREGFYFGGIIVCILGVLFVCGGIVDRSFPQAFLAAGWLAWGATLLHTSRIPPP